MLQPLVGDKAFWMAFYINNDWFSDFKICEFLHWRFCSIASIMGAQIYPSLMIKPNLILCIYETNTHNPVKFHIFMSSYFIIKLILLILLPVI